MNSLQKYSPLVGRILIALPFLHFGTLKLLKWGMLTGWMASMGWPVPWFWNGAAMLLEIVGGLLLIAGFQARWTALALALYLASVTFLLHDFWAFEGVERAAESEHFGKGLMIIGGLLFIYAFGPGAGSIDNRSEN